MITKKPTNQLDWWVFFVAAAHLLLLVVSALALLVLGGLKPNAGAARAANRTLPSGRWLYSLDMRQSDDERQAKPMI